MLIWTQTRFITTDHNITDLEFIQTKPNLESQVHGPGTPTQEFMGQFMGTGKKQARVEFQPPALSERKGRDSRTEGRNGGSVYSNSLHYKDADYEDHE